VFLVLLNMRCGCVGALALLASVASYVVAQPLVQQPYTSPYFIHTVDDNLKHVRALSSWDKRVLERMYFCIHILIKSRGR